VTFAIDPGPLDRAIDHACARLEQHRFVDALWGRRPEVWTRDPAGQRTIAGRLGWLQAIDTMRPQVGRLRAFADAVRGAGMSDVVLLGMGGSSLAAEVLRTVVGTAAGSPRFHVLDSVDPDAVPAAMARPSASLFIVASKSGSTIEVAALAAEAAARVRGAGASDPGSHFVAITDEGTSLHRRAIDERFRDVFINAADVGGRFSALTYFGLVPAALMGINLDALLASAQSMADACRLPDPRRNPGVALGAMLAAAAAEGRDKLVLRLPAPLAPLGLWIEQLVAESTGKDGKGVIPIAGQPSAAAEGDDRIVVEIAAGGVHERNRRTPAVNISYESLGAEFFRWEVATATAGFLLGVNPFDEPNVQQAKDVTRALLDAYAATKRLPVPDADVTVEGARLTLSAAAKEGADAGTISVRRLLRARDYLALLPYLPPEDAQCAPVLQRFRTAVAAQTGCAAMLGFGPRYLHSTGQLHKGGPNSGVFVIVTADGAEDLPVPGEAYSFGVLEAAQAIGDFQALDRLGRRALLLHLPRRDPALLQRITEKLSV
jgi:glucose-6-phosphate isomerase